jgi:CRP/FNR family transcriptional regulator
MKTCPQCSFFSFCANEQLKELVKGELVKRHIKLKPKEHIHKLNPSSIYVLRHGLAKVLTYYEDGSEHIRGFYLSGEAFGFEMIGSPQNAHALTALKQSELCEIPLANLYESIVDKPALQQKIMKLMSQRINSQDYLLYAVAEQRLIGFLLAWFERSQFKSNETIQLGMTREDIGNYLNLAAETVTRLLKKLQQESLIEIHAKEIKVLDIPGLIDKLPKIF